VTAQRRRRRHRRIRSGCQSLYPVRRRRW